MGLESDIRDAERVLWDLERKKKKIRQEKCKHNWETISHLGDTRTMQHCYSCDLTRTGDYLKDPEFDEDWDYS